MTSIHEMPMTPEMRAEKLMQEFNSAHWSKHKEMIAAQIREAEKEAAISVVHSCVAHENGFKEGFSAAKEKAVEIVETEPVLPGPIPQENLEATLRDPELSLRVAVNCTKRNITDRIRQMEAE